MRKDEILADLRGRILDGTLAPGDWLSERALEREYGVSRTPLREVLQKLARAGFLEVHPAKGHQVRRLSVRDTVQIYEAREAVEGQQARLACSRGDAAFFKELRKIRTRLNKLDARRQPAQGVAIGRDLHARIAAAAGNAHLLRSYRELENQTALIRRLTARVASAEESSRKEHLALVDALLARNPDAAESCARAHLRGACRRLVDASVAELKTLMEPGQ